MTPRPAVRGRPELERSDDPPPTASVDFVRRVEDVVDRELASRGVERTAIQHEGPNVYVELGFARGLGKTVITIMRAGTRAHFDVQDWTFPEYIDSRPLELDFRSS